MSNLIKVLIALSCLAFILAVIGTLFGIQILAAPEALSRACSNLALIAIALAMVFKCDDSEADSSEE